jgi:hypothetical protein
MNRLNRVDEKPFEAVAALSDFNQRAYELLMRPWVQAASNDTSAALLRTMHPLRVANWAVSGLNPWLAWLQPAAEAVKTARRPVAADNPLRQGEKLGAELLSASLDCWRALRDAATETAFFSVYAQLALLQGEEGAEPEAQTLPASADETPSVEQGGYPEALARVAYLLSRNDEALPLSRLELRQAVATSYADDLPELAPHEWRALRGTQEVIAREQPEEAVATLPDLLADPADRARLIGLLDKLIKDRRVLGGQPTVAQKAMHARIRAVLADKPTRPRPARTARRRSPAPAAEAA